MDISGRTLTFAYSDKGLLVDLVDGAGSPKPKPFHFDYDAEQGNKNVKLVRVTDPRGNPTNLAYYTAPVDPKNKWKLRTITDRLTFPTGFTYTDPDGPQGSEMDSAVTDAENHTTNYHTDGFGRPTRAVNARNQPTSLVWDSDHNVISLSEANNAVSTWTYDTKTGYPTSIRDAEAVANNTPATVLGYRTALNGFVADLTSRTTPEGRRWEFGYDAVGNLTSVTDPKGVATPAIPDDFQSTYTYDQAGQPRTAVDANGNTTTFSDYDATGFPKATIDALTNTTRVEYDVRGNVSKVTDARKTATPDPNDFTGTYTYDTYGRLLESRTAKDQAVGEFIVTPPPDYDANDNITRATAPNGAETTAVYDKADRLTSITAPRDTATGPVRTSSYTYDKVGNPLTVTEPLGNLTPSDPDDFVTRYAYDEIYQLTRVTDAADHVVTYAYDNVGNLTTLVDPRKNASADPADFTAKFTYDRSHRPRTETDALGFVTETRYDRDGNVVSTKDKENNTAAYVYDERAELVEIRVPHNPGVTRTTRLEYDEVGNRTRTISPRGTETTDDPDDFAVSTVYDKLNRPVERLTAFDRDDPTIRTPDRTIFGYDQVGNVTTVDAPPAAGQTVRNVSRTTYFDNGWVRGSTDPWDIVTTYNYNSLGQQAARTVSPGGAAPEDRADRTMTWDYFPDGKLKSRSDSGVPVGRHVALVDNSDPANTSAVGSWNRAATGTGFTGYDYSSAPAGTGTARFTWTPIVPADGTYEVSSASPSGVAGAAGNAPYTVDSGTGSTTVAVNQTTGGGQWVSLGRHALTAGNRATITLTDAANGTVLADAVKLVRDNTGEPDNESKTFTHGYDANGNLASLSDTSPGAAVDNYPLTYNEINQLAKVEEKLAAVVKTTTTYSYDENGNPLTRDHTAKTRSSRTTHATWSAGPRSPSRARRPR